MPRTLAIGDVHGCSLALRTLLAAIDPRPEDTLVMLGDYVDRGPDSRGVIDTLLEWRTKCNLVTLMGNHEQMMLAALEAQSEWRFWMQFGGKQTLASYGGATGDVSQEHWKFIRDCLPYFEQPERFFVHANYEPRVALDRQTEHFRYWLHCESPPRPHISGKRAYVGHTAQRSGEVLVFENLVCLDTFCHGSGWLTGLDVVAEQIWQVNRNGYLRDNGPRVLPPPPTSEGESQGELGF